MDNHVQTFVFFRKHYPNLLFTFNINVWYLKFELRSLKRNTVFEIEFFECPRHSFNFEYRWEIVLSIRVFLTVNWVFTSSNLNQGFICLSKYVGPSSYWIINNWPRKLYMYILHCFCREQTFLLRWYKCVSQEHAGYATVSVIDVASVTTFI